MDDHPDTLIPGAGGLLIRRDGGVRQIALVRRERHGDEWALPKGKVRPGEDWQQAALREVREETGYQASPVRLIGYNQYPLGKDSKLVMFWLMEAGARVGEPDPDEIKEVAWLSLPEAAARLSHKEQRTMVEQLRKELADQDCKVVKAHQRAFFLSSEEVRRNRLGSAITCTCSEIRLRLGKQQPGETSWATPAMQLLNDAEIAMRKKDVDSGWTNVNAARRMLLFGMEGWELEQYAEVLRRESIKLTSWRQKAVQALLGEPGAKKDPNDPQPYASITPDRLFQCALIADGEHENQYLKIAVRRTNLKRMFLILASIALLLPLLACWEVLPDPLSRPGTLIALEGFGALGAAFSVAISLTSRPLTDKIPEQLLGSFITWMRPVIGAVAALAAYVLLHAGWLPELLTDMEQSFAAMLALAFLAGFSERLVVGVMEQKGSS